MHDVVSRTPHTPLRAAGFDNYTPECVTGKRLPQWHWCWYEDSVACARDEASRDDTAMTPRRHRDYIITIIYHMYIYIYILYIYIHI